jgi:hypothetical protein
MQLAASFCAASGIDAPLLERAIRSLEQHGVGGMRSDLAAVMKAM